MYDAAGRYASPFPRWCTRCTPSRAHQLERVIALLRAEAYVAERLQFMNSAYPLGMCVWTKARASSITARRCVLTRQGMLRPWAVAHTETEHYVSTLNCERSRASLKRYTCGRRAVSI
jgi:hypothetical protein